MQTSDHDYTYVDYQPYVAKGHQLRSAALRQFASELSHWPAQVIKRMTQRADRSAAASQQVTAGAGC